MDVQHLPQKICNRLFDAQALAQIRHIVHVCCEQASRHRRHGAPLPIKQIWLYPLAQGCSQTLVCSAAATAGAPPLRSGCDMKTVTAIEPQTTQTLADETLGIELGDKRLNWRAGKAIEQLGRQPRSSIPSANRGGSEPRSAYDLFAHKNTEAQKILQPHYQSTPERIKPHPRVLVAQATTELDYTGRNDIVGLKRCRDFVLGIAAQKAIDQR